MNNDERILKLRGEIVAKKAFLKKKRFTPKTTCILTLDKYEQRNINVLEENALISLLVTLNSMYLSAKDLGMEERCIVSGFKLLDWIDDIKDKLTILQTREEETKLKGLEERLEGLLSKDKKTELELDEISEALKK